MPSFDCLWDVIGSGVAGRRSDVIVLIPLKMSGRGIAAEGYGGMYGTPRFGFPVDGYGGTYGGAAIMAIEKKCY